MRQPALALALVLFAPAPFAGPAAAQDCTAPQTQTDMNICAAKDFEAADKALNATYRKLRKRIKHNADYTGALIKAQRAWIAYRDANCAFQSIGSVGGTIHPLLVAECQAGMTETRTKELQSLLNCEEGDPTCMLP